MPYTASNIIDLLRKIKKEPITFPHKTHPQVEDVIRKMLVVEPSRRIEWNELFRHPVTRLLEENIEQSLRVSFLCKKEELPLNMSKFYIKTNKVIESVHDICAKKGLNNYVKEIIHNQQQTPYQGDYIRRVSERHNKENLLDLKHLPTKTEKDINDEEEDEDPRAGTATKGGEAVRAEAVRKGCAAILHQRNVYAFLGHLAEELIETHYNMYSQCLSFLIVKKVIGKLAGLRQALKKQELKGVSGWAEL